MNEDEEDLSYSCEFCGTLLDDPISGESHEIRCEQEQEDEDE